MDVLFRDMLGGYSTRVITGQVGEGGVPDG